MGASGYAAEGADVVVVCLGLGAWAAEAGEAFPKEWEVQRAGRVILRETDERGDRQTERGRICCPYWAQGVGKALRFSSCIVSTVCACTS